MDLSAALYLLPYLLRLLTSGLWRRAELHFPAVHGMANGPEANPVRRLEGRKPSQLEQTRPAEPVNFLASSGTGTTRNGTRIYPENYSSK